jgi:hypothetical protein
MYMEKKHQAVYDACARVLTENPRLAAKCARWIIAKDLGVFYANTRQAKLMVKTPEERNACLFACLGISPDITKKLFPITLKLLPPADPPPKKHAKVVGRKTKFAGCSILTASTASSGKHPPFGELHVDEDQGND